MCQVSKGDEDSPRVPRKAPKKCELQRRQRLLDAQRVDIGCHHHVKIYPRDSAVHTDHRHRWSKKWTWSLWPVGNVPGTWVWLPDEERVDPAAMHVWPAEARPILTVVYLCPTEGYKGAQHACIDDQVQIGRQHLYGTMCACQTCNSTAPPRDTGTAGQDLYPWSDKPPLLIMDTSMHMSDMQVQSRSQKDRHSKSGP